MKILNLIKQTPFLLTLIIILLISINNQKQYSRLKILIWNTPSLPLGSYLAISTGTGYIISYLVTSKLSNSNNSNYKKELKYKSDNRNEEINTYQDSYNEISYDNTFIERDVKDPSPTLNASFRIIGRNNRKTESQQSNQNDINYETYISKESENQYNKQKINYQNENSYKQILNDWEDESHTNW